MQPLERLAAVAKSARQPVEQLRMRGLLPHAAKVAGTVDDAAAKVIEPDAIDDRPPRERIATIDDPAGQRDPPFLFAGAGRQFDSPRNVFDDRRGPAADELGWPADVAPLQHVN